MALADSVLMGFVPVGDLGDARMFYGDKLGLRVERSDPHGVVFHGGVGALRTGLVEQVRPARHTVAGWIVGDLGWSMMELEGRGVIFEDFGDGKVTAFPDAQVAWFRDPWGNLLSLTEFHRDGAVASFRERSPTPSMT